MGCGLCIENGCTLRYGNRVSDGDLGPLEHQDSREAHPPSLLYQLCLLRMEETCVMVSDCHCILENLSSLKSACESEQLLHFLSSPYINFHLYQQLNNLVSEQFCRLRFTSTFLLYLFACLLLSFFCPKVLSCRSVPCRPSLLYPSYLNPPIFTHLISTLFHPTSTLSYFISTLSSSPILSQTSLFHPQQRWSDG
jgi:hypothetical protein